jgi:multidrug efflux pump subunit AcrB
VLLKMLPFDNKSEFQVVVDMPAGTPVERPPPCCTSWARTWPRVPEVTHYQAYAGTAAPINFNGLVRQYYLRAGGESGDLQVNLVDKHTARTRATPSPRACARRCSHRPRHGANVKVVEVPPGPPVLSPIVAEVYGPDAEGRIARAGRARRVRASTDGVVDVDDSSIAARAQAAAAGRPAQGRAAGRAAAGHRGTLRAGLAGEAATYLHDQSKYPAAPCCSCRRAPRRPRRAAAADGAQRRRASWCRSASWCA